MRIHTRAAAVALLLLPVGAFAQEPPFLADRGPGVASSIFNTYVRKGELVVFPFYEYFRNSNEEYHGSELGFVGEIDYLGSAEGHEAVLFAAYGVTDDVVVELESELWVTQSLERAPDDTTTGMPPKLEESGLGETEAQVRWRFVRETKTRPELFTNLEVTFPFQKDKVLIGASDWEVAAGLGAVKGFSWGTLTTRFSIGYGAEEGEVELGEYAVEYLKRLSPLWRVFAAVEGEDDELSFVVGARSRLARNVDLVFGSGFGLSEKAEDFAPEIGLIFSF